MPLAFLGMGFGVATFELKGEVPIIFRSTWLWLHVGSANLFAVCAFIATGAAAGLTNEAAQSATVVPFSAGLAVFELVVTQDGMESQPAVVKIESGVPGQVRPVAIAAGPAVGTVLSEVLLDGSASTGSGAGPLRYRWTQVADRRDWRRSRDPVPAWRAASAGRIAEFRAQFPDKL